MRRFHINLNRLAALSATFCALATILWVVSFHVEWHLTFYTASSRYVLRMKDGSVGWYGPRRGGSLTAVDQDLINRMSNNDFSWNLPNQAFHRWFIRGIAKPGTPTTELYEHCARSIHEYPAMAPYVRAWLAALRDPNRFVPAQTMLLLHTNQWLEANAWGGLPSASFPVDQKTGKPDLSARQSVIAQWYDRLETPLYLIWFVWLVLALLIVPFAWLVRPRSAGGPASWAMAGAATASLILIYLLSVGWARSYQMGDAWIAPPQKVLAAPPGPPYEYAADEFDETSIISWRGHIQFLKSIQLYSISPKRRPIEHRTGVAIAPFPLIGPTVGQPIESAWRIPGIVYAGRPTQTVTRPATPSSVVFLPISIDGRPTGAKASMVVPGSPPTLEDVWAVHSLDVSYWLPIILASILPLVVIWKRLRRWSANRRGLCPMCGYDLRATPDRCPECGYVPIRMPADSSRATSTA